MFALSTSNLALKTNANTEAFMVLPMTASLAAMLRGERTRSAWWHVLAGVLSGLAILTKATAVIPAVALLVYLLACGHPDVRASRLFVVGVLVPIVACLTIFFALSAGANFWYANVTYNRLYVNAVPVAYRARSLVSFNLDVAIGGGFFWLLALGGLLVVVTRRERRGWLLGLWGAASYVGIGMTGRGTAHYYVQLLPAGALLGAIGVEWLSDHWKQRQVRYAAYALLIPPLLLEVTLFQAVVRSPSARARAHALFELEYRCQGEAPAIGRWVKDRTTPSDTIYNVGRDPEIYVYAGRLPAARYIYDRPFALDVTTLAVATTDLQDSMPKYIVETPSCTPSETPEPIAALVSSHYQLAAQVGGAAIYERQPSSQGGGR